MIDVNESQMHVYAVIDDLQLRDSIKLELANCPNLELQFLGDVAALAASPCTDHLSCVLLGILHEDDHGQRHLLRLRKSLTQIPVVMLGHKWELANVVSLMRCGALEVIEMDDLERTLPPALQQARRANEELRVLSQRTIPPQLRERLNQEEARIFQSMLLGQTTKQIAAELNCSVRTIHYRKKELLAKLCVANRAEAIELVRLSSSTLRSA